jgi:NAD-dependent deacetylase
MAARSDALVDRRRRARFAAVLSGAGVWQESGISTFRDADGLWSPFDPDELATPAAYRLGRGAGVDC